MRRDYHLGESSIEGKKKKNRPVTKCNDSWRLWFSPTDPYLSSVDLGDIKNKAEDITQNKKLKVKDRADLPRTDQQSESRGKCFCILVRMIV